MKRHPLLLGLVVFGVLLGLFLVSIWALSYFSNPEESLWGGEKIAIIEIQGVILDPQPVVERLIKLRKNDKVKAIVLRIDSPGGAVGPVPGDLRRGPEDPAGEEGPGLHRAPSPPRGATMSPARRIRSWPTRAPSPAPSGSSWRA